MGLESHEGRIPHLYLDTKGVVTCGVGHACWTVDDALAIQGWDKPEAVRSDFRAVHNAPIGRPAVFYASYCQARLSDDAMTRLLESDQFRELCRLKHICPEFDQYPPTVQDGLRDMAFNLGGSFLISGKWPKFREAVLKRNWSVAADECWRFELCPKDEVKWGPRDTRNNWTRTQFLAGLSG